MKKDEISIRKAQTADLQAVYALVVELAIYEKEPQAVTASLSDYEQAFKEGWFMSEIAVAHGEVIGMIIYYRSYSTWKGKMMYLEDFYVKPAYRRYGVGGLLFDHFLDLAKQDQCVLAKWQVLDWNEPALNFYKKQNAEIQKGWWNGIYRFND